MKGRGGSCRPKQSELSWLRRQLQAFGTVTLLGAVSLHITACTPITEPSAHDAANPGSAAVMATDASTNRDSGAVEVGQSSVRAEMACTSENARSCGSASPVEVLACRDGTWQQDEPCRAGERCAGSAEAVVCRPAVAECLGQEPGQVYCDSDAQRRTCINAGSSKELPCNTLERCVTVDDEPKCRCMPGTIIEQQLCVMPTTCSDQNGGCDAQTMCIPRANGRECSACPPGYLGDGERGCEPQLIHLKTSCGALTPVIAPGIYDYRVQVPLVCLQLQIEGAAPVGSRVKVLGDELPADWRWQLSPVKTGETVLSIQVASASGAMSKYTITVERGGGQQAYIKASNADSNDYFGFAMAASDEQLIVGAPGEDGVSATDLTSNDAADSGAAYVFVQQGASWIQQAYVKASPTRAGEFFGASMALAGDTLIVGAPNRDPLAWYAGTAQATRVGAVYVFALVSGAWTQTQVLTPSSGQPGDLFGYSVVLREDTLIVGAPGDSSDARDSGAVYIFQRQGGAWVETQKLTAASGANGKFGVAAALDASRLLVGAPNDSSDANLAGAAFTFVQDGGRWRQEQRIVPTTSTTEMTFGWHVMVDGDVLSVAAPGVVRVGPPGEILTFQNSGGAWTQATRLTAKYPNAADLYGGGIARRGSMLVVGANGDSSGARTVDGDASRTDAYQSGAAYLYVTTDDGRNWVPTTYLKAGNPDPGDSFGEYVTTNASSIFVSAPLESSSSRVVNGDANNNNASRSGAVYVFQ